MTLSIMMHNIMGINVTLSIVGLNVTLSIGDA
jgi:hypothetical protein